jgi:hypothetical protein
LEPGVYWLEIDYDTLTPELQAIISPTATLTLKVTVPVSGEIVFEVFNIPPTPTPEGTLGPIELTATAHAQRVTPGEITLSPGEIFSPTPSPEPGGTITVTMPDTGIFDEIGDGGNNLEGTGGLTVLAIAAAGLVAVVFIARKLRSSN